MMNDKLNIEKKDFYSVGDVIYAMNYNMKFDCRKPISKTNLPYIKNFFLVVYSESQDNMTLHRKNYQALKLTTKLLDAHLYSCSIDSERNPFLRGIGYISCSKLHTFDTRQIIGSIGKLDIDTLRRAFKVYHRFQCELERQFLNIL